MMVLFRVASTTLALIAISAIAAAHPVANTGYGAPAVPAAAGGKHTQCRTVYKSVNVIEYEEKTERKCVQHYREKCDTKYRQQCEPYKRRHCETVYKKRCDTEYKRECQQKYRQIPHSYTEDVCREVGERVCEKAWFETADNSKEWRDDPAACRTLTKTECHPEVRQESRSEAYQHCENRPYEKCRKVPDEVCRQIDDQRCRQQPYKKCRNEPYQKCENVHKQVPKQVTRKKAVRVCGGGGTDYGNNSDDVEPFVQEALEASGLDIDLVSSSSNNNNNEERNRNLGLISAIPRDNSENGDVSLDENSDNDGRIIFA